MQAARFKFSAFSGVYVTQCWALVAMLVRGDERTDPAIKQCLQVHTQSFPTREALKGMIDV
jgi:hypothetical protein